jgi:hypothetical protein
LDPQLRPFFDATSDGAAASALDRLLAGPLASVIIDTVRRELGGSFKGVDHVDDVAADVRLRLIRKLMSLRAAAVEGDDGAIANVAGYATVTAERACYAFLRRQFPERTRFRNRVRYVLTRHPQITFAAGSDAIWRASSRAAVRPAPASGAAVTFLEQPASFLHSAGINVSQPLPAIVAALLLRLDRPIEFDRLVDGLAVALGIADAAAGRALESDDARHEPVDPAPAIADLLEQRQTLIKVWREIVELPPRQRAALLLNLRDPDGGAVLQMLPATGVVDAASIAAALEISPAALDELWARLPLDDLSIAKQLGLTRQQVINLRKSARARLARRFRENQP